ncbi:unnamed protein product [Amoebophrya sp. A25]|nr:unnamed protein product [Amoebophrya sp. A25]|eukprot:GSA25T00011038001.1
MDIVVTEADGLPEGSYVSIRIGDTRRQGPYRENETFRFAPSQHATMKVDLFQYLGGTTVGMYKLKSDEGHVERVSLPGGVSVSCKCLWEQSVVEAERNSKKTNDESSSEPRSKLRQSRHAATLAATKYLDDNAVQSTLQSMVRCLLDAQPKDALNFMAMHISALVQEKRIAEGGACTIDDAIDVTRREDVTTSTSRQQEQKTTMPSDIQVDQKEKGASTDEVEQESASKEEETTAKEEETTAKGEQASPKDEESPTTATDASPAASLLSSGERHKRSRKRAMKRKKSRARRRSSNKRSKPMLTRPKTRKKRK